MFICVSDSKLAKFLRYSSACYTLPQTLYFASNNSIYHSRPELLVTQIINTSVVIAQIHKIPITNWQ